MRTKVEMTNRSEDIYNLAEKLFIQNSNIREPISLAERKKVSRAIAQDCINAACAFYEAVEAGEARILSMRKQRRDHEDLGKSFSMIEFDGVLRGPGRAT